MVKDSNCYAYTKSKLKEMFDINLDELSDCGKKGLVDVEINHNRAWVRDLYEKNKNNLDRVALFYRGTKITYREMFENASKYASSLSKKGVTKGVEVPVCMSPSPEFIYTMMAINLLEAKMNSFGAFESNYVTEIINGCDTDFIICGDDQYSKIKEAISSSKVKEIIMFSLTDSLKDGKDPYIEIDEKFYDFTNKVELYKANDTRIKSKLEFLEGSQLKKIEEFPKGDIDTDFLVTYSGGSTSNRPKAIIHRNRSLVTIGRFQDPDLSGLPQMNDLIGEMIIPPFSNTSLISSMSDVLYKGCTVALEPIYKKEFLLYSLAINKPNYISVPRNMLVDAAKKIYKDPNFKNFTMPYMMMLTSVGEPTSKGEEKFINKMLKKAKCGVGKLPRPLAPVPLSIGGGDTERGGMFFTPYRSLQNLHPKYKLTGTQCQLKKYAMVQMEVFDENGNKVPRGQIGILGVKTPTQMKEYKNNPEATKKSKFVDSHGEIWNNCNAYAYIERYGTVNILGRVGDEFILNDGTEIPMYQIGLEVEKDTKHILSYEVVNFNDIIVIHLEFMPTAKQNKEKILMSIKERIINKFGEELANKILYRVRSFEEGFVGNKSEKRNHQALLKEGITEKCVMPVYNNGEIQLKPYKQQEKVKILK